ncbi:MAG: RNA polymerase sigma factor [Ktedonobacterales bacterium]
MQSAAPAVAVSASNLVATARARLRAELAELPAAAPEVEWQRLRLALASPTVSRGALVHRMRALRAHGEEWAARELFVLLLERCELANRAWVRRTLRQTPLAGADATEIGEDLRQELALALWEQVMGGREESWELFFARALDYAQRHVATRYMERRGLWRRTGVARPSAGLARLLVSLSRLLTDEDETGESWAPRDPRNPFRAAELADLRMLVGRLPERQRAVIVMRYWQGASEDEMSRALGVTTRTIRNLRLAAYALLREWYVGEASDEHGAAEGNHGE